MNRIDKLKNDVYSFEELITLEKNATQLRDSETLRLIEISRASKPQKERSQILSSTKMAGRLPAELAVRKNAIVSAGHFHETLRSRELTRIEDTLTSRCPWSS